jgi:hypothetical protein
LPNSGVYQFCNWLQPSLREGAWKVDVTGSYCTTAASNPDGTVYLSYCDGTGYTCEPGIRFSVPRNPWYNFALSSIVQLTSLDGAGALFNVDKTDTRNLIFQNVAFTAIYLGGNG